MKKFLFLFFFFFFGVATVFALVFPGYIGNYSSSIKINANNTGIHINGMDSYLTNISYQLNTDNFFNTTAGTFFQDRSTFRLWWIPAGCSTVTCATQTGIDADMNYYINNSYLKYKQDATFLYFQNTDRGLCFKQSLTGTALSFVDAGSACNTGMLTIGTALYINMTTTSSYSSNSILYSQGSSGPIYRKNANDDSAGSLINSNTTQSSPSYSPDGQYIIYRNTSDGNKMYRKLANDTGNGTAITTLAVNFPTYSPDGQYIVYENFSTNGIYLKNANDTSNGTVITSSAGNNPVFSADGQYIYYVNGSNNFIYKTPVVGGGDGTAINSKIASHLDVSPDGQYIIYRSGVADGYKLYRKNANDTGNGTAITSSAVSYPSYSFDGNYILYTNTYLYIKNANDTGNGVQLNSISSSNSIYGLAPYVAPLVTSTGSFIQTERGYSISNIALTSTGTLRLYTNSVLKDTDSVIPGTMSNLSDDTLEYTGYDDSYSVKFVYSSDPFTEVSISSGTFTKDLFISTGSLVTTDNSNNFNILASDMKMSAPVKYRLNNASGAVIFESLTIPAYTYYDLDYTISKYSENYNTNFYTISVYFVPLVQNSTVHGYIVNGQNFNNYTIDGTGGLVYTTIVVPDKVLIGATGSLVNTSLDSCPVGFISFDTTWVQAISLTVSELPVVSRFTDFFLCTASLFADSMVNKQALMPSGRQLFNLPNNPGDDVNFGNALSNIFVFFMMMLGFLIYKFN